MLNYTDPISENKLYIAIKSNEFTPEGAQTITPRIMNWSKNCWILDFSITIEYWRRNRTHIRESIVPLIEEAIKRSMNDSKNQKSFCYCASLANNPWKAILLLYSMEDKGLEGYLDFESGFGKTIYENLPNKVWWKCLKKISYHFKQAKIKGYNPQKFLQQTRHMKQSMERLGMDTPISFKCIDPNDLQRRFGEALMELWLMAFSDSSNKKEGINFESIFPWHSYFLKETPKIKRNLDYPITQWDEIEPFLNEDLNKLCLLNSFSSNERLVSLKWHINLHDMSSIQILISFRHPHNLHTEYPHQKTALLQAYYSFTKTIEKSSNEWDDDYLSMPVIVSWEVIILEKLLLTPQAFDLFGERDNEYEALLQLENRLPIKIKRYDLVCDWNPEDSYKEVSENCKDNSIYKELYPSLISLGIKRPLFIYREPIEIRNKKTLVTDNFLERTMDKWWRSTSFNSRQRDYYCLMDNKKRCFWVFHDTNGKWYIHGIFG